MTEFSVGDRVLVPGEVVDVDVSGAEVDLPPRGHGSWFRHDDLRPDTGGRDLTAQDVNDALNAYDNGQDTRTIADRLNRIARGDAEAGDDTAPPAAPCPMAPDGQHRWGTGRSQNECDECDAPRPSAAAGPRAGDTAPDDEEVRMVELALRCAETGEATHWPTAAAFLAQEIHRLRSEVATLRAVGNKLADKAELSSGVDVRACVAAWRSAAGGEQT